ncbi:restriction endonuclease subunit S [Danxiaibacter flavus]|uniref:Restriction endonuclease subunit S n=1 Tax=Danxiaibacter flavus TaxID=3049108 RepID=A0ABV3ZBG8_9BACT|nr:restriction endonuclease subunit S [Chitinophagaceae bacterium DXS]
MSEKQKINQLPKDWNFFKLSEIGKIISGGTPSTAIPEYWGGNISWISPADLTGYKRKEISKGAKSITVDGLKNSSARLMPKGSVLFSSRAPIGYVAIASNEMATNQGFKSIIPNDHTDSNYLYYFLKSAKQMAESVASGTTFKEISLSKFSELNIPLPPLPIQQAIVSKIEELFSELDKGIEQLKTAQQQLKTYRQAVLKWAFEGKLTNENVKDGELPEGWKWVKLNEIGKWTGGGTPSKQNSKFWTSGNVLWVSPKDMKTNVIHDTQDKITKESIDQSSAKLIKKDSILFVVRSGIIRRTLPIAIAGKELTTNQDLQSLTLHDANPLFVYWNCIANEQDIRNECAKDGTTVDNLDVPRLKAYIIVVCSPEEQQQVVQEIESRFSVADKIEESINQSLQQAEALRQSILKRAFEGKLI